LSLSWPLLSALLLDPPWPPFPPPLVVAPPTPSSKRNGMALAAVLRSELNWLSSLPPPLVLVMESSFGEESEDWFNSLSDSPPPCIKNLFVRPVWQKLNDFITQKGFTYVSFAYGFFQAAYLISVWRIRRLELMNT
jgi:hypothetical protein